MNIIFVGRLIYAKGVDDLIAACGALLAEHNELELTIVGGGNYRPSLEHNAFMWGFYPKFTGELDHAGVMAMLRMSDIFVNPSYSEGLPTSVMEAASVGLPIIATDVGGTNEIIEDDKSGLLYKAGDIEQLTRMLKYMIDNPARRAYFGPRAKESARKFDWDKITDQYEALLKEVAG